jgi:Putative Actinobacterial Holin-X, holin superfamily III
VSTSYNGPSPDTADPLLTDSDARPSIGELLADVSQDVTTLLRQEVELAKAEVRQSATRAAKGAGMFAGAGVSGHVVVLFVSIGVWWGLGDSIGHGWSAIVVAAIWLIIGAVLAATGRGEIKTIKGAPLTADTMKKIPNAVTGNEETS